MPSQDNPKLPLGWELKAWEFAGKLTHVKTQVAPISARHYLALFPIPASLLLFVSINIWNLSKCFLKCFIWLWAGNCLTQILGSSQTVRQDTCWFAKRYQVCQCWCFLNSLYLNVVCFLKYTFVRHLRGIWHLYPHHLHIRLYVFMKLKDS